MNNKFHAISMCTLIAAFAASSWAAAVFSCPSGFTEGDGKTGEVGVCYYDIQEGEQTLTIPSSLKSFKLRYDGSYDISKATVNMDNPDGMHYTFSVSGSAQLKNGGELTIKNRLNLAAYAGSYAGLLPYLGLQPAYTEGDMFKCSVENCNIAKETGFNALAIEFTEGEKGKDQGFVLSVKQELFDFVALEVYYTKGVTSSTIDEIKTKAGSVIPSTFPMDEIEAAVGAKIGSVALLHGKSEYNLASIPSNVDVNYVYLDRTFSTKESGTVTSTIMLPFKIATDNIVGAFDIFAFNRVEENKMFIKAVYCSDDNKSSYCPKAKKEENGTLTAYNAYIVRLKSDKLGFNGGVTLVETPSGENPTDVLGEDGDWAFRGTLNYKKWDKDVDDELTACNGKSCAYGYAASDDKLGQFVRIGDGAYIFPFRGYLVNTNPPPATKLAPANASYVLRPTVDIPDEMEIVVDGDNGQTTSIGRFDTRTGEIHINNMKHTYDLKGRRVNGTNNARGAYYGKKVLMK